MPLYFSDDYIDEPPITVEVRYDNSAGNVGENVVFEDLNAIQLETFADILHLLKVEKATLHTFVRIATAYFRLKDVQKAEQVLHVAVNSFHLEHYRRDGAGKIFVKQALAGLRIHQAKLATEKLNGLKLRTQKKTIKLASGVEEAIKELETEKKNHLNEAQNLINEANLFIESSFTPEQNNMLNFCRCNNKVLQAEINVILGQLALAIEQAKDAADDYPNSYKAKVLQARLAMLSGAFRDARDRWCKIIDSFPILSPATNRYCLGVCYYEMKQEGRAQECFERCLEFNANYIPALIALFIIEKNLSIDLKKAPGKDQAELRRNMKRSVELDEVSFARLDKAFKLNEEFSLEVLKDPQVLIHYANRIFFETEKNKNFSPDRIDALLKNAIQICEGLMINSNHAGAHDNSIRRLWATASYMLGRNLQKLGNFHGAADYYKRAREKWIDFSLNNLAYCQVLLIQAAPDDFRLSEIESIFKEQLLVAADSKEDEDVLFLFAHVKARKKQFSEALPAFQRVIEKNPNNAAAHVELAKLYQMKYRENVFNAEEALHYYQRAINAILPSGGEVPSEMYCNMGVLFFRLERSEDAVRCFDQALEKARMIPDEDKRKMRTLTYRYNRARALEQMGKVEDAEGVYRDMKAAHPGYVDATLRLSSLLRAMNRLEESEELLKDPGVMDGGEGVNAPEYFANVWNTKGFSKYAHYGADRAAKDDFERLYKMGSESKRFEGIKHDAYAKISQANILFQEAERLKLEGGVHSHEFLRKWNDAQTRYDGILKKSGYKNLHAANGCANLLFLKEDYENALYVYQLIRDADVGNQCPDAWVNEAWVHYEMGRFETAATLFEQSLRKFYNNNDSELMMALANCHFHLKDLEPAKVLVQRVLLQTPWNDDYWLFFAQIEEAEGLLTREREEKEVVRNRERIDYSKTATLFAIELYDWLSAKGKPPGDSSLATLLAHAQEKEAEMIREWTQHAHLVYAGAKGGVHSHELWRVAGIVGARVRGEREGDSDRAFLAAVDQRSVDMRRKEFSSAREGGRRSEGERAGWFNQQGVQIQKATAVTGHQRKLAARASERAEVLKHNNLVEIEKLLAQQRRMEREEKEHAARQKAEMDREREEKRAREAKEREEALERRRRKEEEAREVQKKDQERIAAFNQSYVRQSQRERKKTQRLIESQEYESEGTIETLDSSEDEEAMAEEAMAEEEEDVEAKERPIREKLVQFIESIDEAKRKDITFRDVKMNLGEDATKDRFRVLEMMHEEVGLLRVESFLNDFPFDDADVDDLVESIRKAFIEAEQSDHYGDVFDTHAKRVRELVLRKREEASQQKKRRRVVDDSEGEEEMQP